MAPALRMTRSIKEKLPVFFRIVTDLIWRYEAHGVGVRRDRRPFETGLFFLFLFFIAPLFYHPPQDDFLTNKRR
ncbi:hypothetical protein ASPZODRAFT_128947, partial [Penicilliopsis zonata CBS 506.65]